MRQKIPTILARYLTLLLCTRGYEHTMLRNTGDYSNIIFTRSSLCFTQTQKTVNPLNNGSQT